MIFHRRADELFSPSYYAEEAIFPEIEVTAHVQSSTCSKITFLPCGHAQSIICRQLFSSVVATSLPTKIEIKIN